MELLCSTDVATSSEGVYITITAVIAFLGVTIAAALNYRSNIKTNNYNIYISECRMKHDFAIEEYKIAHAFTLEETKLKHTFTKECFDVLVGLAKQLKTSENITTFTNKDDKTIMADFVKNIKSQVITYESILPYINYSKIADIESELMEIYPKINVLSQIVSEGTEISPENKSSTHNLLTSILSINHRYAVIINNELIELSETLRSFNIH